MTHNIERNKDNRRCIVLASLVIVALTSFLLAPINASAQTTAPRVELVFVLDTTGSMGGLIEGAKAKIWDIANMIVSAEPTPDVRIGLVGYRDRGDAYVTQVFDLTDDIDAVYANLMRFGADGGGDTPESVNQALAESLSRIAWTEHDDPNDSVLRLLFLVGDAPPHMDYGDTPYTETVARAVGMGIVVNTVQCGNLGGTQPIWQEIASLGGGSYAAIEQSGGVAVIETPFDADLARLNREIGETIVGYGTHDVRSRLEAYQAASEEAAPTATADRLSYNRERGVVAGGGADLVDAVNNGSVDLDDVEDEALPANMQSMNDEERAAYIEAQTARRGELQSQVDELLTQREEYINAERERMRAAGTLGGFDAEVDSMIRTEGAEVGLTW